MHAFGLFLGCFRLSQLDPLRGLGELTDAFPGCLIFDCDALGNGFAAGLGELWATLRLTALVQSW